MLLSRARRGTENEKNAKLESVSRVFTDATEFAGDFFICFYY